jgi:glycosyltransferase involved in cell wall biosynthesis
VREDVVNIEDYVAAGDVGLYTSETESFGLSILETQFHGRPVVAFRVGGIPEVITDGETGFLHPFGDVAALATSLNQLAASPELAKRMGESARQQARARFSTELVVPQYEQIYERLIAG